MCFLSSLFPLSGTAVRVTWLKKVITVTVQLAEKVVSLTAFSGATILAFAGYVTSLQRFNGDIVLG